MEHVVILAGGLGSRLHKFTANLYPKILISMGNETMLDKLVNYYSVYKDLKSFNIVVSTEENQRLISNYLNRYHSNAFGKNTKIDVLLYKKLDGSFNTIYNLFKGQGLKNVVFNWSDIIPTSHLQVTKLLTNEFKIITDVQKRHRMGIEFRQGTRTYEVVKYSKDDMKGNIPGYFFIGDFDSIFDHVFVDNLRLYHNLSPEIDLMDALEAQIEKNRCIVSTNEIDFIDIGDVEKYEKYMETISLETRYFNSLEITENTVRKKALNEKGMSVIDNELNWYSTVGRFFPDTKNRPAIPRISNIQKNYDYPQGEQKFHSIEFSMNRIDGKTVDEYLWNDPLEMYNVLRLFDTEISKFHNIEQSNKPEKRWNEHHMHEYFKVTYQRLDEIFFMLQADVHHFKIGDKIHSFKGDTIHLLEHTMKYLYDAYSKSEANEWGLIHGDPNTSNVMISNDGTEMFFIDPRGLFGHSLMFGDIYYDWAKFIYGLQGYSRFNLDKTFELHYDEHSKTMQVDFFKYGIYDIDTVLHTVKQIRPDLDIKRLRVIVGLIHVKLAQYIRNNPSKMYATYYYGKYLLETTLSEK
ncbi:gp215 [Sphingomonas phage PAU]|uniref:gp215 n=1 Tax=Sphingomonas phage PAU TaxID=1150991 RepID=UPI0002573375|nr:gp215 [Sphingomonas phage PAU]AFF28213.1 gp215 [Sphingomonas phage PAU]